jgi:hypothetical protein
MQVHTMRVRLKDTENVNTEYASTKSCIDEVHVGLTIIQINERPMRDLKGRNRPVCLGTMT